ncbi:MAG: MBL fold metallo-hydrolase [Christensenellaceae bacterium]|nr:MBL fold metallo-hydrolase [Christensenellaceae bacterium]
MKLTILGTGCAWTKRGCANYLLDNNIVVDPGFGSIKQLLKSDDRLMHHEKIERIDLVIITHFHSDHYFDIPYILQKCAIGKYADRKLTIIAPEGGKNNIMELCRLGLERESYEKIKFDSFIEWHECRHGEPIKWHDLEITPLKVEHGTTLAFGYIIKQPSGKLLGFTGDTCMCDSYQYMLDNCDTLVACMSNTKKEKKLFNIVEGIQIMKKYRGKCCIIPAHMTSQGWDYARERIRVPQDLEAFDLEVDLPYDFELKNPPQKPTKPAKNFKFSKSFGDLKGTRVDLHLLKANMRDDYKGGLPAYQYEIIDRTTKMVIGNMFLTIGYNPYVLNGGSVFFDMADNYGNLMLDTMLAVKKVALHHRMDKIYLSIRPDSNTRKLCDELGAHLAEIKTFDENNKVYINNSDDPERCIYIWKIN